MHNESLAVVAVRIGNEDCSPVRIDSCDTAPRPAGFAEAVCDESPVLHSGGLKGNVIETHEHFPPEFHHPVFDWFRLRVAIPHEFRQKDLARVSLATLASREICRKISQNLSPAGVTSTLVARAMPTDCISVVPVSDR